MSLEALRGTPAPLDPRIHEARPHRGQREAASLMRELLLDSEIRESHRENDPRVQDAYSLRCAPQVLGAVADAIRFAEETVAVELNASTDNPLVFPDGEVISGGNFHGQPVAQALDFLAMTLTTLQAIAERRVERLVNPDLSQGLPAFLTADPGLSSGFMMVQITAASLVAESRTLWPCRRASDPSRPTPIRRTSCRWEWRRRSRRSGSWPTPSGWSPRSCSARLRGSSSSGRSVRAAESSGLYPPAPGAGPRRAAARRRTGHRRPDLERLALAVAGGELDPGPGPSSLARP